MANNITFTKGRVIPYTNSGSDIPSGKPVLCGSKLGIAISDIPTGGTGNLSVACVCELPKVTGVGTAGMQGSKAFWDSVAGKITGISSGNTEVGYFWRTSGDDAETGLVKLAG